METEPNYSETGKRRDVHRRGAFQPQFYRFVGWYYLGFDHSRSVARCSEKLEAFKRSEEAWDFGAIVYGDFGKCGVCGARFASGEVWQHDETKDMIHVGCDCAEKYGMLSGTDWSALEDERRRAKLAYKTSLENFAARERIARDYPWFLGALWLADSNDFIRDVGLKYMNAPRFVSERQITAVIEAGARTFQRIEENARRDRERAEKNETRGHVGTVGKRETWKGCKLVFFTTYETAYGVTRVCKFEVGANLLVWKATSTDLTRADVGKTYTLTGTVKEWSEYKGEKQTMVTRCKVEVES